MVLYFVDQGNALRDVFVTIRRENATEIIMSAFRLNGKNYRLKIGDYLIVDRPRHSSAYTNFQLRFITAKGVPITFSKENDFESHSTTSARWCISSNG